MDQAIWEREESCLAKRKLGKPPTPGGSSDAASQTHNPNEFKLFLVDRITKLLDTLVRFGAVVLIVYYVMRGVGQLAGKFTYADIGIDFIAKLIFSQGLAWSLAGVGTVYGFRQRNLRREETKRMGERLRQYETQIDPRRSSSRLESQGDYKEDWTMTDAQAVIVALSSGLSLVGLAVFFLWIYRDYRRDLLRARLFTIRAELFDSAAEKHLDFDHPAYGLLRSTLNGFLRFGHRYGGFRLIGATLFLGATSPDQARKRWEAATADLPDDVVCWLEGLRNRMHLAFLKHLCMTSATGTAFLILLTIKAVLMSSHSSKNRHDGGLHPHPPEGVVSHLDAVALAYAGA
jgi:hypothetical protein